MQFKRTTRINWILLMVFGVLTIMPDKTEAGPFAGAICSAGCAAVVVACYSAAGAVFGTVTAGVGSPPAILACNTAFGTCMANCALATAAPVP